MTSPFWRAWHQDFATGMSRPVDALPVLAGQLYDVNVGGEYFIPDWHDDAAGSETTIYQVGTGDQDPTRLFSFAGSWYGLARCAEPRRS